MTKFKFCADHLLHCYGSLLHFSEWSVVCDMTDPFIIAMLHWILCSCIKSSCNSINPLMFLIADCCGCARVVSDPDLIQSKCLGWEWLHGWESPMRIWLQVDNHRSQCSVLYIYTMGCTCITWAAGHTVLAIHQFHNLACQGPKCVVARRKISF